MVTDAPGATRPRVSWWAFWSGLRLALRHWPLLLLFYLALFVLAGLLLLPWQSALVQHLGHSLAAWEVAEGMPAWLVGQIAREAPAQSATIAETVQWLVLSLPAWPLIFSLPFAVLGGGALTAYAKDSRQGFWPAVARYLGSFTLLQVLETVILEATVVLGLFLGGAAAGVLAVLGLRTDSGALSTVLLVLAGIVLTLLVLVLVALFLLIPWWFEYARALAVVQGQRHVLRVLGQSAAFLRRNLGPAASLALFSFLLVFVPYGFCGILTTLIPPSWWPAHIAVQQLLIVAIIGTRLARLAAQVRLVQARAVLARQVGDSGSSTY